MSNSQSTAELSTFDNPLGDVALTAGMPFGMREAVLAGVVVSPGAAAREGGIFADSRLLTLTEHITCSSITLTAGSD
jgi:hypothetical protein